MLAAYADHTGASEAGTLTSISVDACWSRNHTLAVTLGLAECATAAAQEQKTLWRWASLLAVL